jgi:regulator of replication initiation timing
MLENIDLSAILEEKTRELVKRLLNFIEQLSSRLREAQAENQRLRDENNRLKGEQGKPKIKANVEAEAPKDHSSEKERHKPRTRHGKKKQARIVIDREEVVQVDQAVLPADAIFKGYEENVVQDILLKTDNVRFLKEKYYSPALGRTYLAELPTGYEGQFGPGIKTLAIAFYHGGLMSEPKIIEFLENVGIRISKGTLSNLLVQGHEDFHAEKEAVYEAGLESSSYQHLDDTPTRVNGQNQYCHVVCNLLYTAYFTKPSKDRLSVLDVLRQGRQREYLLNAEALAYLDGMPFSKETRRILEDWRSETVMEEEIFLHELDMRVPILNKQHRGVVLAAAAVAAYHAERGVSIVQTLVCDDAPQFKWLTRWLALCWIHEGRHYKKLEPVVALHQTLLKDFLTRFWAYYDQLLEYRQRPTVQEALRLEAEFDALFDAPSGYAELDKRMASTHSHKDALLLVLKFPELPLHNNPAELGARRRVRKRDVSFGPRTEDGKQAWDTFMTLAVTTKKLNVSFYEYVRDRVLKRNAIPPLPELIQKAAHELTLGQSYSLACP